MTRSCNYRGEALGLYEAAIGRDITVDGPHWLYGGREPLGVVRRFVAMQFDDELPENINLVCVCGTERCVRPSHMDWTP